MTLPLTQNANQVTYATSVAAQLAQIWLWDPAFALAQDSEVYEKMLRDPVIAGSLDHLQRLVVGHDWSFDPGDDDQQGRQMANVLEDLTKQQRGLTQALYNLSRATFFGAGWALIFPEKRVLKIGDGKPREWTVVARVRDVDKRRFRLSQAYSLGAPPATSLQPSSTPQNPDRGAALQKWSESVTGYNAGALGSFRWEFHRGWDLKERSSMWWGPLSAVAPDERWIQHVPDTSERGMGYGYGLADDLYFYYWAKQTILRYGLQGLERWGQGFLYAKTKALRDGFAKGTSQASALQQTVATLRTFRSENIAAVDENTELALLDMPSTAEAACREWIEYLDREIVKRILAALQPTGGQAGHGSFSSAKVEEGSSEAMVQFLRSPLEETWTHTVVRFLVEHNKENLAELGLSEAAPARIRLHGKEIRDLDQVVKVFTLARDLAMPVRREDFYAWTGLTEPTDLDESVTFPAAGAAPAPGASSIEGLSGFNEDERTPVGEGGSSVAELAEAFALRDRPRSSRAPRR